MIEANKHNIFELDNARNMSSDDLSATFVATDSFWRLLTPKNHVILGSRGSGKTALAKMLSHDHLAKLDEQRAKDAINNKSLIGIFLPTSIEWVGALQNKPWQNPKDKEQYFVWNVNFTSCVAFLSTAKSCLNCYIENEHLRIIAEIEISSLLSKTWLKDLSHECRSFAELEDALYLLLEKKNIEIANSIIRNIPVSEATGAYFYTDIFFPLKMAISRIKPFIDLPDSCVWMVLIDEAEFLDESHYLILNSCMRSDSKNIVFKITTMPYHHKTLNTNVGIPLNEGNDFEYVYIDEDPAGWIYTHNDQAYDFAKSLFNKRASRISSTRSLTVSKLLGESYLLRGHSKTKKNFDDVLRLINLYCTNRVVKYAEHLHENNKSKFDSAIYRKMYGFLRLRDEIETNIGRKELKVYSGYQMVLRCGDGNPRKMIRLFNLLLRNVSSSRANKTDKFPILSQNQQNRIVTEFSQSILEVLKSDTTPGSGLYNFINTIGLYFKHKFLDEPLSTNTYCSFEVNEDVSDEVWDFIKYSVGLGLLHPNINPKRPTRLPHKSGTFRLSYALAPMFSLFPRKAEALSIRSIMSGIDFKYRLHSIDTGATLVSTSPHQASSSQVTFFHMLTRCRND